MTISSDQVSEIIRMRGTGASYATIARGVGTSKGTVWQVLVRAGLVVPRPVGNVGEPGAPTPHDATSTGDDGPSGDVGGDDDDD